MKHAIEWINIRRFVPLASALSVAGLILGQTAPPVFVSLAWPGDNAQDRLQKSYGKVITYEDPVWIWSGELARNPQRTYPPEPILEAPRPLFTMPALAAEGIVQRDLENMLAVFNQVSGTKFGIRESRLGFHIVPVLVHDENGTPVKANNLLDAFVTVPEEERYAFDHFTALGAAIERATGAKIHSVVNSGAFGAGAWQHQFNPEDRSFVWGASAKTGREALVDLLDLSATSFTWKLLCHSGSDSLHDHTWTLDIRSVPVSITNADGNPVDWVLEYDRCGNCPPLRQMVLPSTPKQ